MVTDNDIRLDNVTNLLTEYALRFNELIKVNLQKEDKKATGNLLASISTKVEVDGYIYTVTLNSLKYLKFIELGQRPHWVPSKDILNWVIAKKLPTRELTGDKSLPTEKQLAYLVNRKISIDGVKPVPIIANTVEELNEKYLPRLIEALKLDIYNAIPIIKLQLKFSV